MRFRTHFHIRWESGSYRGQIRDLGETAACAKAGQNGVALVAADRFGDQMKAPCPPWKLGGLRNASSPTRVDCEAKVGAYLKVCDSCVLWSEGGHAPVLALLAAALLLEPSLVTTPPLGRRRRLRQQHLPTPLRRSHPQTKPRTAQPRHQRRRRRSRRRSAPGRRSRTRARQ